MMRRVARLLFVLAGLLVLGGLATCHFGVRREIAQIPAEQRARMTDTDWEGVEAAVKGLAVIESGVAVAAIGGALEAWRRYRLRRDGNVAEKKRVIK